MIQNRDGALGRLQIVTCVGQCDVARIGRSFDGLTASRRPFFRDGVLMLGGAGGIAAASISDHWWLAGGVVAAAAVVAVAIHYGTKD